MANSSSIQLNLGFTNAYYQMQFLSSFKYMTNAASTQLVHLENAKVRQWYY